MVATNSNGCEVEAVIFDVVAGIQAAVGSGSLQVEVNPNPMADKLIVSLKSLTGNIEIKIYNNLGEIVIAVQPETIPIAIGSQRQEAILDVSALSTGMYWVQVKCADKIFRKKVLKK